MYWYWQCLCLYRRWNRQLIDFDRHKHPKTDQLNLNNLTSCLAFSQMNCSMILQQKKVAKISSKALLQPGCRASYQVASVAQTRALVSLPGKSGSAPLLEILSPNTSCRLACSSIIVVTLHYTLSSTSENEDKSITKHSCSSQFLKRANCVGLS